MKMKTKRMEKYLKYEKNCLEIFASIKSSTKKNLYFLILQVINILILENTYIKNSNVTTYILVKNYLRIFNILFLVFKIFVCIYYHERNDAFCFK